MQVFRQEKERCFEFLHKLAQLHELIAPVKRDVVRFASVKDVKEICLEENSYFPLKDFFFKKEEVLFNFYGNKMEKPKPDTSSRVFFGIRRCDLNGIMHQDKVFLEQAKDPYYKARRQNAYLLGYHCSKACSKYSFCGSMGLADFFDLMYYDRQKYFLIEVGSEKGSHLVNKFQEFFVESGEKISDEDKKIPESNRLEVKNISNLYNHPGWEKGVELCLSCSACTALCPTCYCFSIHDEVTSKEPKKGERLRIWSSCQLQEFTKVAGNHIFRKERAERFKHRIFHQLDYFKQKNGVNLCVGCGRCIEGCPTRIDFVNIINGMKNG